MSGVRPPADSGARGGFVLIAVLWLLVALGAVGLDAGIRMRTERLAAANLLDGARARQAALAGAEYARSRLTAAMFDRAEELRAEAAQGNRRQRQQSRTRSVERLFRSSDPAEDPWRNPEELVLTEMQFGDARFALHLRDVGAALNPNGASEEMLRNFFTQGLQLDYAQGDRLAQAIMDWRDEDDLPRLGGAEREEYLQAAARALPPNRPIAELSELRHVLGMTEEIYRAALPYLTLVETTDVNLNAAPGPVLLALPGMTPGAAEEILRLRESGIFPTSRGQLMDLLSPAASGPIRAAGRGFSRRDGYRTDFVEIIADGFVEGSPVEARVRVAVLRSNEGAMVLYREID